MTIDDPDLRFLNEALPQLQDYLLSGELYWPLSGSLPRLTPGALLLVLTRIRVTQPGMAPKLQQQFEVTRTKWHTAWEKKVAREISNRLRLWSNFLADFANSQEQTADSYPAEVRGRAILQLLLPELPDSSLATALVELDMALEAQLHPSEFLWDARLQVVFPKDDFWFLYGKF